MSVRGSEYDEKDSVVQSHPLVDICYMDQFDQARNALEEAYARKVEGKYQKAITALNRRIEDKRRLEEQRRQDDSEESK